MILATHQIQFLKNVDHIFLLEEGELKKQGDFNSFKHDLIHYFPTQELPELENQIVSKRKIKQPAVSQQIPNKSLKKLYENLEGAEAVVSMKTYLQFIKYSHSSCMVFWCFVLFLLFQGSKYCTSLFYSFFGPNDGHTEISNETIFVVLFVLLIFQIITSYYKYIFFVKMVLVSNTNIHKKMTEGVVRASPLFFDTHQSGYILNRFSNDIGQMDSFLTSTMIDFLDLSLNFIAGIIISGSNNFWLFIPAAVIMVFLYKIFVIAKPVILELKKLDLQNKGPIFSYFSSTITGLTSINVYKRNKNFIEEYARLIENSARCNTNFREVSRGFCFVVEHIAKITSIIGLFLTLMINDDYTGLIGQQIIYLIIISDTLQWGLRQAINADSVMSSTRRALNITELKPEDLLYKKKDQELVKINQEPEIIEVVGGSQFLTSMNNINYNELKGKWPKHGQIEFRNVCFRYRDDLNLTLNGLTFKISPGEKIGIVGRTGAGKSSIIQALFRMLEICDGQILIDGIDIKEIGLHTLRGNMSIIPQNPFVFLGSIRRNIDPMRLSTDNEIDKSLENVELKEHIDKFEKGIDSDMSYAKGARAILKRNQILILDEATANVDINTEILIQKKIKELFNSCTILTVAHRLLTITDYDKVMVIDSGKLFEFDQPFLLLRRVGVTVWQNLENWQINWKIVVFSFVTLKS